VKPPIITVNISDPLPRTNFAFAQRVIPGNYSHTISAFGGYDTATFTLNTTQAEAEDWLEYGLMREVTIYGSAIDIVWEGFINEIRIVVGPLTATTGPLMDVANPVAVLYTPLVHGDTGEVSGSQTLSAWGEDTTAQVYGEMPKILNAGTVTDANAIIQRDTFLNDNKWPKATESLSSSSNRPVTVTIGCKGYFHLLNWYYYNADVGTDLAEDKIIDVLTDTPNISWLTFDDSYIDPNGLYVPTQEISYRTALTVIKDIVVRGDATNNRWLFYVLANREVHYSRIPTSIGYMARVSNQGLVIKSARQAIIEPWRLLPGQ